MKRFRRRRSIIPGFGLSFGVTMTVLSLVVLIPLCSLVVFTSQLSLSEFWYTITRPRILSGYRVSISTAFTAALVNAVMGFTLAWVLVRYDFPGKRFLDGIIELPFALPTAVAGISLTHMTTTNGWVGRVFYNLFGIRIAYTRLGITIALIFIGIPFVVRSVQPVLEKIDIQYEEAAMILGADRRTTFRRVIFPELLTALISGFTLAFARSIGEYGSVVFIAGNTPYETEIAPLLIMSELQEFDYAAATSIALVMLAIAFLILSVNAFLQSIVSKRVSGLTQGGIAMELRKNSGALKWVLILLCAVFLAVFLLLPLGYIVITALGKGVGAYLMSITDGYALKAAGLTICATLWAVGVNTVFGISAAWCLTKFAFRGKKLISTFIDLPVTVSPIIAGLIYVLTFGRQSALYPILDNWGIQIIFAVPGIVLATIFVTFPFISRELIPVLTAQGTDEEEAAALMGAGTFTIFRRVTLPHIKWALLYGIVLCTARAMGEFGAVSVLSGHLRGKTNTLPLYIELLYQGYDFTGAFAASSILVILAVVVLVLRVWLEHRGNKESEIGY